MLPGKCVSSYWVLTLKNGGELVGTWSVSLEGRREGIFSESGNGSTEYGKAIAGCLLKRLAWDWEIGLGGAVGEVNIILLVSLGRVAWG